MGRNFQELDEPHFDYKLERIDRLPDRDLRGPVPDLREPYFVCIGGSHVFGRFCNDPFSALLSRSLSLPVLNLGLEGNGPQTFIDDRLLGLINGARFAVVGIVSARIGSNSGFVNSPSGRRRGERLSDGKKMSLEEFLEEEMKESPHHEVTRLVEETRDSWVSHYRNLLNAITVPRVLHWFSTVTPYRTDNYATMWKLLGRFPQMVNGRMIGQVRPFCEAYVETVCRQGLPQPLWEADRKIGGTVWRNGKLFNEYFPSPEMHVAAASDLLPVCKMIASQPVDGECSEEKIVVLSSASADAAAIAGLCEGKVECFTYRQVLNDKGLLPSLTVRRPRILHVRRRDVFEGYLIERHNRESQDPQLCRAGLAADFTDHVESIIEVERLVNLQCREPAPLDIFIEEFRLNPEDVASHIAAFTRGSSPGEAGIQAALQLIPNPPPPAETEGLRTIFERISLHVAEAAH